MPTLKITKSDGQILEISDLSLSEVKELAGLNGHSNGERPTERSERAPGAVLRTGKTNDYPGFKKSLTEKARKFFRVLSENPNGIGPDLLAEKIGFTSGSQIGGMAGGGLSKRALRFGIELPSLYRRDVKFGPDGRSVMYYPGPNIGSVV